MFVWSVNYLYLTNAAFLLALALFLVWKNNSEISRIFFVTNMGLVLWNLCNFVLGAKMLTGYVDFFASVQMAGAMIFANGIYYFSQSYPVYRRDIWHISNIVVFATFLVLIFFTSIISKAELQEGELVYRDGMYWLYASYLSVLALLAMYKLMKSYREMPEYRGRIRYFFIGISIFVVCGITFNLVLPSFGNYDYLVVGRLSATAAPVFIFYAITKHEFLDVSVIINKNTSWAVTFLVMLAQGYTLNHITPEHTVWNILARGLAVAIAAFGAYPLQKFLLTTAKRKFVRGWYSTEEVFNRLSGRVTQEKNREAIFREVVKVLDEVFEVENTLSVVAIRDDQDQFSYYKISGRFLKIKSSDALIRAADKHTHCAPLDEMSDDFRFRLQDLGFPLEQSQSGVVIPFHSPEYLEGLVILGEKSSQLPYSEEDLRFFNNLIIFIEPVLYRLTPMERLERLYNENRARLHEAEIQLIRAQKIESIVHATRQCHHEIRTPLNIIRMGMNRIKSLEDLENYKEVAREEIDHALTVVEETLTITDVNRPVERVVTDIDVNEVIQRCLRLIDKSRFNVVLDLGDVPRVPALFSDIQVVVTNLIHNAMDAMPDGGSLAFSTRAIPGAVEVSVEDSGGGIPDEVRSRVWEPYFSGKGSEVGNSNAGRGWGLTIVNRIVNEHAGTIKFTTELNQGTKFIFTLPMADNVQEGKGGDGVVLMTGN